MFASSEVEFLVLGYSWLTCMSCVSSSQSMYADATSKALLACDATVASGLEVKGGGDLWVGNPLIGSQIIQSNQVVV